MAVCAYYSGWLDQARAVVVIRMWGEISIEFPDFIFVWPPPRCYSTSYIWLFLAVVLALFLL